ncbi:MAG TPA: DUF4062 domain-containing protein, partial [Symbiobacteriaceae bacterium]|nr:DUF4062 domain-containing protein [Symbiobacteriaceae bacterium]
MQGWHIRPFISSTFQDMQAERDVLAADVFPRLRALCTGHGATLSEVDLRWGITEEDQQADRVLPLCLELVDRCRPYFIGLLGDRYGWVPVQIPPDLLRAEPWLDQFRNRSVTELEMQHGVLNHAREQTRAFFYFRTSPTGGAERAELSALKQRIESAGFRVRRYTESQELANVVFTDLSEAILHDLTGADEDADLREEQWQQRRLAQLRQGYLPRPDCHDALDRCTEKAAAPLLLTTRDEAEASLVLVNWAAGKAEAEAARRPAGGLGRLLSRLGLAVSESVLALTHTFHGSDPRAALTGMMRQVMLTYRKSTDGTLVIPEAPEPLRTAFAKWLRSAGRHRPVILALDGLSALEGADLSWVPRERLPGVHLVMAVGHGPVLDQLRSLGLQELIVGRQSLRGRELAVTQYLNRYGKRLLPDQVARIAQAHQSGNPVYLRALLEALRIYGDHRILQEQLNRFLSAQTATDLFDQVLERYETDYARPSSPGLVTRLFQYLLCARAGLMESELLALFQAEPTPVPPAWVLPLLTAAQDAGILTRGLVQFATDEAQAATRRRYLGMKPDLGPVHRHLAMLFLDHADPAGRGTECLYHLVHAKDWEALGMALSDSRRLLLTKPETLSSYWDLIQTHTSIRAAAVFLPLAGALAENILVLIVLAHLFTLLNDPENARLIEQHLEGLARGSSDVGKLITALSGLVLTAVDRQEWERACLYAKECEALAEAAEKWLELANVVCTHGLALYFAARPGEAHSLLLRFEERFQAEDRLDCLALCLTMRAQFSAKEGEQTRAEALMT